MEPETKAKGLLPHARDNQLHVGSSGDPIRPLVAEILIFTFISREGKSLLLFCAGGFLVERRDRTTVIVPTHKYGTIW